MTQRGVRQAACAAWVAVTVVFAGASAAAAECRPPRVIGTTVIGIRYCVDPAFNPVIAGQTQKIRGDVRAQRQAGRLIIYASTPISARGGGHVGVNLDVAASVKLKLEKEYGGVAWVLDPGKYQMPDVDGRSAGGGEYMVMWTEVIAGEDGAGRDFDMAHFTGPSDIRAFFGCGREDIGGCITAYITTRAGTDTKFRQQMAESPPRRQAFIRYYALRASSAYSTGSHDEWNIFVRINRKRPVGEQVAVFFDGRPASPAEMESEVAPGYELR